MDINKQRNDWTCGPTALAYFLALQGYNFTPEQLEEELCPTEERGTEPQAIENLLLDSGIDYEVRQGRDRDICYFSHLPMLININWDHEGDHYMVVESIDDDGIITMWNPYTAEINYYHRRELQDIWFSPIKKLLEWSLHLT